MKQLEDRMNSPDSRTSAEHDSPAAGSSLATKIRQMSSQLTSTEEQPNALLLPNERSVMTVRLHPASLLGPLSSAIGGLVAAGVLSGSIATSNGAATIWLAWGFLLFYLMLSVAKWSTTYFAVTDRRMILVHGISVRKITMLSVTAVTGVSFESSSLGRFLGYRTFIIETTGQNRLLRKLHYLPYTEKMYIEILEQLFQNSSNGTRQISDLNDRNVTSEQVQEPIETPTLTGGKSQGKPSQDREVLRASKPEGMDGARPSSPLPVPWDQQVSPSFHRRPPVGTPEFVGRLRELADLRSFILQNIYETGSRPPVLLVTGLAGVGKTELASRLAYLVERHFPDGQLFVQLRGTDRAVPSQDDALEQCLRALGVSSESIPSGLHQRAALYQSMLEERSVLIVIDDASNDDQVKPFLPEAARCAAVITSRKRLSEPRIGMILDLPPLAEPEALELLTRYVGAEEVAAEPLAAQEIIRSTGHLPLAIRTAGVIARAAAEPAAGFRGSPLRVLSQSLKDTLAKLQERQTPRSPWLESTLQVSYGELRDHADLLVQLMDFLNIPEVDGSIAASLVPWTPEQAEASLNVIAQLGLLEVIGETPTRYRLHDLVHGQIKQIEPETNLPGIAEAAARRLLNWYLSRTAAATSWFHRQQARSPSWPLSLEEALLWLELERTNIVALVEVGAELGCHQLVAELAAASAAFFDSRGYLCEAERVHRAGLDAARRLGDRLLEAKALNNLGTTYTAQGKTLDAERAHRDSLAIANEIRDTSVAARASAGLGRALAAAGSSVAATAHLLEALAHAQLLDRAEEGRLHYELGALFASRGNGDAAVNHYEASLRIADELEDPYLAGTVLVEMGTLAHVSGRLDEAEERYVEALQKAHNSGDRRTEAATLVLIGNLHADARRFEDASHFYRRGLDVTRSLRSKLSEGRILANLAIVQRAQGYIEEALSLQRRSLAISRELKDRAGEATALASLANLHADAGRSEEALSTNLESLAIALDLGDRSDEARLRANIGNTYMTMARVDDARSHYEQSLSIFNELGNVAEGARVLAALGNLHSEQGDLDKAAVHYNQSLEILDRIGDAVSQGRVLANIANVYSDLGRLDDAAATYERSAVLKLASADESGLMSVRANLGNLYAARGNPNKAIEYYREALDNAWRVPDRHGEAIILADLGRLYSTLGDTAQAVEYWQQSVGALESLGDERAAKIVRQWLSEAERKLTQDGPVPRGGMQSPDICEGRSDG